MKSSALKSLVAAAAFAVTAGAASAADILCQDTLKNHLLVDDTQVSACLAAGVGNIGNGPNDPFLTGVGSVYAEISDTSDPNPFGLSYTQANGTGTWSFDESAWSAYGSLAIGFKFGTGNQPDEWFVYAVEDFVSAGEWTFVNVFQRGGGLSHMVLYGTGDPNVPGQTIPVPGTAILLGAGLLTMGLRARRRRD